MLYASLIAVALILFIVFFFYGNSQINKRYKKKHDDLFRDLSKYDHHVFRNIIMKTFGKSSLGNKSRLFISHVVILGESVIIMPHQTNSRREIKMNQPILQFSFNQNPEKLSGVSFLQKMDKFSLIKNKLTLKFIRIDQAFPVNAKIELDFERKVDQLKALLGRHAIMSYLQQIN